MLYDCSRGETEGVCTQLMLSCFRGVYAADVVVFQGCV